MGAVIEVHSAVRASDGDPAVVLKWGKEEGGVLSPAEARAHALSILQAAEAAECDSFLTAFMRERMIFDTGTVQGLLTDFRAFRAARRERN